MTITTARPTRRTLVRGAAWSVPAISIAAAAPAFAASTDASLSYGPAVKWGTGNDGDLKHVSWDLVLTNGSKEIDTIQITFTYTKVNNSSYLGKIFTIRGYGTTAPATWTVSPNAATLLANPSNTVVATNAVNILPSKTLNIHTDFAGDDNSIGDVRASILITYVGGTSTTLNTPKYRWAQGNAHNH